MQVYQIVKLIDAPFQIRIFSFLDFRTYCERFKDELVGVDKILKERCVRDYDFKAEVAKIVEQNPHAFQWVGDQIILKTTDRNRVMNLEVQELPHIENDTIIILTHYGSNNFDDRDGLYRLK